MARHVKQDSSPRLELIWLSEASELKRLADLCWRADEGIQQQLAEGRLEGVATSLLLEGGEAEADLNWLFNNLAAFAVYYLALAILTRRNPQRFAGHPPAQRFVELVEECGVNLTALQEAFLRRVENWFAHYKQTPYRTMALKPHEAALLKRYLSRYKVTHAQKAALDELYANLQALARHEMSSQASDPVRDGG